MKVIPLITLTGRKGAVLRTQNADKPAEAVVATSFAICKTAAVMAQQRTERGEVAVVIRRKMDKVLDKFDALLSDELGRSPGATSVELEDDEYAILRPVIQDLILSWAHQATHALDAMNEALRAANGLPALLEPRDDLDPLTGAGNATQGPAQAMRRDGRVKAHEHAPQA